MQQSEETRKTSALMALAENFGKEFSDNLLDIWLEMLSPYPAQQVNLAVKTVLEKYEFKTLPPFAVIKRALDDLSGTSSKALDIQAIAEWGVLLETIDRVGCYGTPRLHPTTDYVVRLMGGWESVCCWPEKGMEFRRKEFIELWAHSHGRADKMALGAGAVAHALGEERKPAALLAGSAIGGALQSLAAGDVEQ